MMLMSPMEAVPFGTSRLGQEGSFLSFLLLVFPFLQSSQTSRFIFHPCNHSVFVHLVNPICRSICWRRSNTRDFILRKYVRFIFYPYFVTLGLLPYSGIPSILFDIFPRDLRARFLFILAISWLNLSEERFFFLLIFYWLLSPIIHWRTSSHMTCSLKISVQGSFLSLPSRVV
jgi:hypothetical protein